MGGVGYVASTRYSRAHSLQLGPRRVLCGRSSHVGVGLLRLNFIATRQKPSPTLKAVTSML
jgi:hypothetical protein